MITMLLASFGTAQAGRLSHASILLHALPAGGADPCGLQPSGNFVPVTAAPVDPSGADDYYVYVIGHDPDWAVGAGLAGLQFGTQYEADGPGDGLVVHDFEVCATIDFSTVIPPWPSSGSGTLLTWDPINACQRQPYAVGGYFYLTAYSPSIMAVTTRPLDNLAKVANCASQETVVYPGRLGWISFGGAEYNDDTNGFDPTHDAPMFTRPVLDITAPGEGITLGNNDVSFEWCLIDDETPNDQMNTTWNLDGGDWRTAPSIGRLTVRDLAAGPHVFWMRAVDQDGEVAVDSLAFSVISGLNDFPTTRIIQEPVASPTGPYRFRWTGSDTETPTVNLRYMYFLQEVAYGWCPRPTPQHMYAVSDTEVEFPSLPHGTYVLTVKAIDEHGQVDPIGAKSNLLIVIRDVREYPNCAPWVEITGEPDSLLTEHTLDLHWRGYYGKGPHDQLRFAWRLDGGAWSAWQADSTTSFTFAEPGAHRIQVKARDAFGFETPHLSHVDWNVTDMPAQLRLPTPIMPIPVRGITTEVMITPNPSPKGVSIRFGLGAPMPVGYRVYDVRGRLVRDSGSRELVPGEQRLDWDGRDAGGRLAPAGVYYIELGVGAERVVRTVSLVR
ncbi:MAG TPA: hypothetical protein VF720_13320 [Candidatus Eisenbacteria bacterium]